MKKDAMLTSTLPVRIL